MTEPKFSHLGALTDGRERAPSVPIWRRLPWPFLVVVVLPTLVAAIYYWVIASPVYVSEAQFIVRAPTHEQPSAIGLALQGVGIQSTQTDAFSVHEYIESRDALRDMSARMDLRNILARPGSDVFSRYPRPWEGSTFEDMYKAYGRFVTVGYDATTGISTIRVKAFRPADAQRMASTLLDGGEKLVNRLNDRAATDTVSEAEKTVREAELRVSESQASLTSFRNREQFIDPESAAKLGSELIGGLLATAANLRADRAQLAADAPSSPQLPILDSRIRAYDRQIEMERAKIAGDTNSLAPKIGTYETLALEREFANRALASASQALDAARLTERRQRLYLDRVVSADRPDKAVEPRRLLAVLSVLAACLLAFGIGWLVWAGVREHGQFQ